MYACTAKAYPTPGVRSAIAREVAVPDVSSVVSGGGVGWLSGTSVSSRIVSRYLVVGAPLSNSGATHCIVIDDVVRATNAGADSVDGSSLHMVAGVAAEAAE